MSFFARRSKIENIPEDTFIQMLKDFKEDGWQKLYHKPGWEHLMEDDAKAALKKDGQKLVLKYNVWDGGTIKGPESVLEGLRMKYNLS